MFEARTGNWLPMPEPSERKRIYITAPPEYEMKLLTALSFFLGRKVATQAAAALAMYIRQSHDRILTQCEYYAKQWGLEDKWEVLDLIYSDPSKAEELMKGESRIHKGVPDVFSDEEE